MSSPYEPSSEAGAYVLLFRDRSGVTWSVREVPGDQVMPGRVERCLVLANAERAYHIWSYPENWRELAQGELLTLMDAAA